MERAMSLVKSFLRQEEGTETVEWGIMAGLIVTGLVGIVAAIGLWVKSKMTTLQSDLGATE